MDPSNTSSQTECGGPIDQRSPPRHAPQDLSSCCTLSEVEMQMETAQQWLTDLKATQCRLKSELNRANDTLLKTFPIEIICRIFMLSITSCSALPSRPESADGYSNPFPQFSPLRLGAICKAWRHVAWSTPQLWSSITIQLDSKVFLTSAGYEIAEGWLKRSGCLPLCIQVYQHYSNPGHHLRYFENSNRQRTVCSDYPTLEKQSQVMDLVNHYHHRWLILDLQLPRYLLGRIRKQEDPNAVGNSRSGVQLIVLRIHETDTYSLIESIFRNRQAHHMLFSDHHSPLSLRLIDTSIGYIQGIKWKNLRTLFANTINTEDLRTIISNAPSLASLEVLGVRGYESRTRPLTDGTSARRTRKSLRTIKFKTSSIEGLEIFREIAMPSLISIDLTVDLQSATSTQHQSSEIVSCLVEFIRSSPPPLSTLTLEIPSLSVFQTLEILHILPSTLTNITLRKSFTPELWEGIFHHYGRPCDASGGQILFPNLREITFEHPAYGLRLTPFCWETIANAFGEALSGPTGPFLKKLHRLTISYSASTAQAQMTTNMNNETVVRLAEFIEQDLPLRVVAKMSPYRMETLRITQAAQNRSELMSRPYNLIPFTVDTFKFSVEQFR